MVVLPLPEGLSKACLCLCLYLCLCFCQPGGITTSFPGSWGSGLPPGEGLEGTLGGQKSQTHGGYSSLWHCTVTPRAASCDLGTPSPPTGHPSDYSWSSCSPGHVMESPGASFQGLCARRVSLKSINSCTRHMVTVLLRITDFPSCDAVRGITEVPLPVGHLSGCDHSCWHQGRRNSCSWL